MEAVKRTYDKPVTVAQLRAFLAELPPEADHFPVWSDGCDCIEAAFAIEVENSILYVLRQG